MRTGPPTSTGPGRPGVHDTDVRDTDWPLQSHLELGAFPGAVPCARLHSRLVVREWGYGHLAEIVELIVSELTTNAVQATNAIPAAPGLTGTGSVRLWLRSDGRAIVVQVWDGSRQTPVQQDAGPDAESGRGLLLVDTLSADWGSQPSPDGHGKVVWAVINSGPLP